MLSQTQSPGQAQPGGLNPRCAGCPPAHAKQGRDVGDVGPVPAATILEHSTGWWQGVAGANRGGE